MEAAVTLNLEDDLRRIVREEITASQQTQPGWMDVPAAAAYLSLSEWALRALVKKDAVPFCKVGGRIKFSAADLDAWVRLGADS